MAVCVQLCTRVVWEHGHVHAHACHVPACVLRLKAGQLDEGWGLGWVESGMSH